MKPHQIGFNGWVERIRSKKGREKKGQEEKETNYECTLCTCERADVQNKCSVFNATGDQFIVGKSPHFNKSQNAFTHLTMCNY